MAQKDAVAEFITAQMSSQHIPGLSLAVIRGREVLHVSGYGAADLELNVRVTPETVFR